MKKTEVNQKKSKLMLTAVSSDNKKQFSREVYSLNEVYESGHYKVVGWSVSEKHGFPPAKYCNCKDCYIEAQLIVTRNSSSTGQIEKEVIGQNLTISNKEDNTTAMYLRSWNAQDNEGLWSDWQMVATGDIELIKQNNNIGQAFTKLSNMINNGLSVRFARIEEDEVIVNIGSPSTVREVVYCKFSNTFVAYDGSTYWDSWDGMEAYMGGGAVRKDKVYMCGTALYTWNGFTLTRHNAEPSVEFGSVSDSTHLPTIATNRARCMYIQRKDITYDVIQAPNGWRIWIQLFDTSLKYIAHVPDLWDLNLGTSVVKKYPDNAVYLNMVFKKEDNSDITEEDLYFLRNYIHSILHGVTEYELQDFNNTRNNITIAENRISISSDGFSLTSNEGAIYYVGYVEGEDENKSFVLDGGYTKRRYAYIDSYALQANKMVSFLKAIIVQDGTPLSGRYLLLAAWEQGNLVANGLISAVYTLKQTTTLREMQNYIVHYNKGNTISILGKQLIIQPDGFGIGLFDKLYYAADVSKVRTEPYVFEVASGNGYIVVDTTKFTTPNVRTELADVVFVRSYPLQTDIPIAYYYAYEQKLTLMGQFDVLYRKISTEKTNDNYNDEVLFSPEFYAYKHGRRNNANGVGTGWYERFRITHISDVHGHWSEESETLEVSNPKTHLVINTGDNAHGTKSEDAPAVKQLLNAAASNVKSYCRIPYLQVPGNHDVPGLTKKEFFDIVCSMVGQLSQNVVWGDAENYRAYGYADFTDASYEGNFRIIMLDPFDYDDGLFEAVYPHMVAVFSQKQVDWLIDTLLDAATKGLNVITAMHYSFGDAEYFSNPVSAYPDAYYMQDTFMIPDIIDAIQKKTSLTREYPDVKGYNNIVINRDFSSAPELNFVAHLFGHIHSKNHYQCQKADGSKKYDMLMLGEAALATYGNALNMAYREIGSINGIAFSALEIDVVEKAVYRVAYGSYLNCDKSNSERTTKIPYRFSE